MNLSFKKEERLKSRKVIGQMFKKGESFGQYPLRLIWVKREGNDGKFPIQFAVSVPKKKFPKAVQRNHIKRKIREAYRLHKHKLYERLEEQDQQYGWMILYVAKEKVSYAEIETSMKKVIPRFVKAIKREQKKNE